MSQFFMHQRASLIDEAIDGLLVATPWQNLSRLAGEVTCRVVLRNDWHKQQVALISGGGSGHEPAHVGFVGRGMLTAAVCGDLFTSPSTEAILRTIMQVCGRRGCLLIVKNYTGDRLNFGLAAERAKQLGYSVDMVLVQDDISLPDNPQPRGIAGTLLVHKCAGYVAEAGGTLQQVSAAAQAVAAKIATIGMAFANAHTPGEQLPARIAPGECELGVGIHGEPGVAMLKTQNSRQIVHLMVQKLLQVSPSTGDITLLINNLGGFSQLEMAQVVHAVMCSSLAPRLRYLLGPATMMSALDMRGFSLSVLAADAAQLTALQAPVEVSGWCQLHPLQAIKSIQCAAVHPPTQTVASDDPHARTIISSICRALVNMEQALNLLDAQVGDGDTGTTFARGARALHQQLDNKQLPLAQTDALVQKIGEIVASAMGGSSGALLSILFTCAGQQLTANKRLASALLTGLERMKYYGGAQVGDRTMIDALEPALKALAAGATLHDVARAAQAGAAATAQMKLAKAGRAAYLNQHTLAGVKDPGAHAVEGVFTALAGLTIVE